jgi:hypothetical protein
MVQGVNAGSSLGCSVRVLVDGAWGFAASGEITEARLLALVESAVAIAKGQGGWRARPIEIETLPAFTGSWELPIAIDPFSVPLEEKVERLLGINRAAMEKGASYCNSHVSAVRERKWLANTFGTRIEQSRVRIHPSFSVTVVDPKKGETKPDADIWAFDTTTNSQIPLIEAKGYDGGPFFSPDGKWICYRSDRRGDDKLQIFVAKLKFENDAMVGVEREFQLTDDENVNWAPYWHPSGRFLVFGSSAVGHSNYEVFSIRVDEAALERGEKPAAAERVTFTPGADVLPAFSADGAWMMWTSQRGPLMTGEQKPSSQLWISRWIGDSAPATDSHE